MKFIHYLDIAKEDPERIKKGRKNVERTATLSLMMFGISLILIGVTNTIIFGHLSIIFLIMMIGLIIKREIYSIAIILKEKELEK